MQLFGKQMLLLEKSLDFRSQRNNLLASNVANAETPGYKARDMVFEKALGKALHSETPGPLQVTNPRHMDGRQALPLAEVQGQVIESATPMGSADGNTVDLESEMAKLGENQLAYQVLTRMMSGKFSKLKAVIREEA